MPLNAVDVTVSSVSNDNDRFRNLVKFENVKGAIDVIFSVLLYKLISSLFSVYPKSRRYCCVKVPLKPSLTYPFVIFNDKRINKTIIFLVSL